MMLLDSKEANQHPCRFYFVVFGHHMVFLWSLITPHNLELHFDYCCKVNLALSSCKNKRLFYQNKKLTCLQNAQSFVPTPSIFSSSFGRQVDTSLPLLRRHFRKIQHGGRNDDIDGMALVAGMGVGVLLLLIFWTLGIVGCVALSRAEGPQKWVRYDLKMLNVKIVILIASSCCQHSIQ
mgnify:FL=1